MPLKIFDFMCGECEKMYEAMVRDDETPTCSHCGATENQEKRITGIGHAYATDSDAPKTDRDLRHYLGNGVYEKGYKRS